MFQWAFAAARAGHHTPASPCPLTHPLRAAYYNAPDEATRNATVADDCLVSTEQGNLCWPNVGSTHVSASAVCPPPPAVRMQTFAQNEISFFTDTAVNTLASLSGTRPPPRCMHMRLPALPGRCPGLVLSPAAPTLQPPPAHLAVYSNVSVQDVCQAVTAAYVETQAREGMSPEAALEAAGLDAQDGIVLPWEDDSGDLRRRLMGAANDGAGITDPIQVLAYTYDPSKSTQVRAAVAPA